MKAAEPVTLRFATVAPEGTGWAREFKAFARDAEVLSDGNLRIKWYFGGIAGDESLVPERIRRGQLDAEAAAASCTSIAPSLRVMRVVGMFRRREETHAIIARLRPKLDAEFHKAGYTALSITWFGTDVALSREPIRSMAPRASNSSAPSSRRSYRRNLKLVLPRFATRIFMRPFHHLV